MAEETPAEDPTAKAVEGGGETAETKPSSPTNEGVETKTDESETKVEATSRKSINKADQKSKSKSVTDAKSESSERKSLTTSKSSDVKEKSNSTTEKVRPSASEPRKSMQNERSSVAKSGDEVTPLDARPSIGKRRSQISKSKTDTTKIEQPDSKKSLTSISIQQGSKEIYKDVFGRRKSSRSIGKAVGSVVSFRRGSIAEYFDRQKTAKFMNTYKLDSDKPFNVDKVEKILKEVLIEALDNLTYDADKVPKQAKWASSVIRTKVKEQEYDRYKLICNVTIGEKRSQDMYATYRFLWDADRDKHAAYVHENMYVFAIAVCFGIYYE